MNFSKIVHFLLLCDWIHWVNAKLRFNYNNSTLERVFPLIKSSFIHKIFPDYPCLFINARPDSYVHSTILNQIHKELSPNITLYNTNFIRATSVCRGLIIVSTSMNVSVDFIMQNKAFHKNMRIYIILIKYWNYYLFFQEHWAKKLLDFEILVVTVFPKQIKIYRLDAHSSDFKMAGVQRFKNYFPSFHNLTRPDLMDYKGRQVTVSTFQCNLFNTLKALNSTTSSKEKTFGIEESIFLEIAQRLNLTWKIKIPPGKDKHGVIFENDTITEGIFFDLAKGNADFGFCTVWFDLKNSRHFDMSTSWSAVCPKFLFPKYKKITTTWQNLFQPFPWQIWVILFTCIVLQTYVLKIFSAYSLRMNLITFRYYLVWINSFLDIIRILFYAGSIANKRMLHLGPLRHLISWWFVFALVLMSIYSSSYYSHLTSPGYNTKIEGIEELLEQNFKWGSPPPPPHDRIFHNEDPVHIEFGERYEVEHSVEERIQKLQKGNYAAYCTSLNNLFFMDVDDMPSETLNQLRSFRKCLVQQFVSFGLRRGTSYLEQVNKIIQRLLQSGIIDYWLIRLIETHYKRDPFTRVYEYKPPSDKNNHEPLTLSSLEGIFYLYMIGLCISCVVLLLEIQHKNQSTKKHSKFALSHNMRQYRMQSLMVRRGMVGNHHNAFWY